jgi:hypothetical protein
MLECTPVVMSRFAAAVRPLLKVAGAAVVVLAIQYSSQPASAEDPHLISTALWSYARGVRVSDNLAYVAFPMGFAVYNVANPAAPVLLGRLECPGGVAGLEVVGTRAYLAVGERGLFILDVTDPTSPAILGSFDTAGEARGVAIAGHYAFVADGYATGLQIIDVADPTAPVWVAGCSPMGACCAVCLWPPADPKRAYCAEGVDGLTVFDVSNPQAPVRVGYYWDGSYAIQDVAAVGDYLYCAGERGEKSGRLDPNALIVYNVSNPYYPQRCGVYENPNGSASLVVKGPRAYVAGGEGAVTIVDVTNPYVPTRIGGITTGGFGCEVVVQGDRAYLAAGPDGLRVLDVIDPVHPTVLGRWWESSRSQGVFAEDGLVYVTDPLYGLHVVDASEPEQPEILGRVPIPGFPLVVARAGSYAYVAADDAGLAVVDVSDPADMTVVAQVEVPAEDFVLASHYAYVVGGPTVGPGNGLRVIDVVDPENPVVVANCPIPDYPRSISISGRYACVATGEALQVVDIAVPQNPVLRGRYNPYEWVKHCVMGDGYAYVSIGNDGLFVIDVSDPDAPVEVAELRIDGITERGRLEGNLLYLAASGLRVIDVSDPEEPVVVGCNREWGSLDVDVEGDLAYVTDGACLALLGLDVSAVEEPRGAASAVSFELRGTNPVRGTAEFFVRAAHPDWLRVEVTDVQGRLLQTILDRAGADGDQHVRWDAGAVPSGVYYLRAITSGQTAVRPVVVVR